MKESVQTVPCRYCGTLLSAEFAGGLCPACALRKVLREDSETNGVEVGRYRLLEKVGEGGMGSVWLAEDPTLDRLVAVKILTLEGPEAESRRARLQREARAMASLNHPHVIRVFEVGEAAGQVFFAMEYAEGGDLRLALRDGPWEPRRAVRLLRQAADAVAHAHAAGVLHRDLKPGNVLLTVDGQPRLADFGLAAPLGARGDLTLTDHALGTPAYMAPEVAEGRPVDARVDVYGLGALLYELLTGRPPFAGQTTAAILTAVSREDPIAPRSLVPGLDADLETICLKCLEKEPRQRYDSAAAVESDLAAWLEGRAIVARPLSVGGKAWRWARRFPGTATALGAAGLALSALAVVATVSAFVIGSARDRAEAGEAVARERLQASLLEEARNRRITQRPGQRVASLVALGDSAEIEATFAARNEAVAALALPDLVEVRRWELNGEPLTRAAFDAMQRRVALERLDQPGLEVRSVDSGQLLFRLETDARVRGTPRWSPSGNLLACRFEDDVLRVWRLPNPRPLWAWEDCPYPGPEDSDQRGHDLLFGPDESWLGHTSEAGGYVLRDLLTGQVRWTWDDVRRARAAELSPDGQQLALANFRDFTARFKVVVVDLASGTVARELEGFGSAQRAVWNPRGDLLAVAGTNRVDLIRVADGYQLRRFEVPDGPAQAVWWSADGQRVFAWSDRARFRAWDVASGELVFSWYERIPLGAAFGLSADRRTILAAGDAWQGVEWRWEPSPVRRTLVPPPGRYALQIHPAPGTLDFSPDGKCLLVAGLDRLVVFDLERGSVLYDRELLEGTRWTTARFGRSRSEIWWSQEDSGLWRLDFSSAENDRWRLAHEQLVDPAPEFLISDLHAETGQAALAAYDVDRFRIVALDGSGAPEDWSGYGAFEAVFAPDGKSVFTMRLDEAAERGSVVRRRSLVDGTEREIAPAEHGGSLRLARGAERVLAVTGLHEVRLWPVGKPSHGRELPLPYAHAMGTYSISHDGGWVAAWTGEDLAVLDGQTGEPWVHLTPPPELYGEVREMRFSPDGRFLAVLRRNGVVSLWDLAVLRLELDRAGL